MTQGSRQAKQGTRRAGDRGVPAAELMRAKMELVAARERGEAGALTRMLQRYPGHAPALTEFGAALVATSSYDAEEPTPAIESIAARARARALAAVFPPARVSAAEAVGQRARASLKALRLARGLSLLAVAQRLGLGADVLSSLEAGLIRAASIPVRVQNALGEALGTGGEQVRLALQTQAALAPALLRSREGATLGGETQPELDFAEAVRLSTNMSEDEKARWLAE
jgi:transcriptional regulator with XRE-family HTH domain